MHHIKTKAIDMRGFWSCGAFGHAGVTFMLYTLHKLQGKILRGKGLKVKTSKD
jgi:hypothetical protein